MHMQNFVTTWRTTWRTTWQREYASLAEELNHRPQKFGGMLTIFLHEGFPAASVSFAEAAAEEVLWALSGETNAKWLPEGNFWKAVSKPNGEVGEVYGALWRDWGIADQIDRLLDSLETGRRREARFVSSWQPENVAPVYLSDEESREWGQTPGKFVSGFQAEIEPLTLNMRERLADLPEELEKAALAMSDKDRKELFDRYQVPTEGLSLLVHVREAKVDYLPTIASVYGALCHILAAAVRYKKLVPLFVRLALGTVTAGDEVPVLGGPKIKLSVELNFDVGGRALSRLSTASLKFAEFDEAGNDAQREGA